MIRKKQLTTEQGQDEDVLLCSSLVKTFQELKGKTNKRAKMKVIQVYLNLMMMTHESNVCCFVKVYMPKNEKNKISKF